VENRLGQLLRSALQSRQQTLDWLGGRLQQRSRYAVQEGRLVLQDAGGRMGNALKMTCQSHRHDVKRLEMQLRALSPLAVLQRGYSVTRLADGRLVGRVDQLAESDDLVTQLADGIVKSTVTAVERRKGNDQ